MQSSVLLFVLFGVMGLAYHFGYKRAVSVAGCASTGSSMNQQASGSNGAASAKRTIDIVSASLKRRYAAEKRFRFLGMGAVVLGLSFVGILFADIIGKGYKAFQQSHIQLSVDLQAEIIDPTGTREHDAISRADYQKLVRDALKARFPDATSRKDKRALNMLMSPGAPQQVREMVMADPGLIGTTQDLRLLAKDDVDMLVKGHMDRDGAESERRVKDQTLGWIDSLVEQGMLEKQFNVMFFTKGASREPELAGIAGALVGSAYTLMLTLLFSFPIAVGAALYLEEYAPKNRWTDLFEVNVNNLAAVPSIVFGLLGLAVFINFFGVPRSTPLIGALVLTLMTLPTIIIASRAALKSAPPWCCWRF